MPSQTIEFESPRHLLQSIGGREKHLHQVDTTFGVTTTSREGWIQIEGESPEGVQNAANFIDLLRQIRAQGLQIMESDFHYLLKGVDHGKLEELTALYKHPVVYSFPRRTVVPKTLSQKRYLKAIDSHDVVLGIGPAGTGKTFLAVAAALQALQRGDIDKLVLTRPAVEAGEALGFLPGDLEEKIQPYLRPLYDAMHDLIGREDTLRLMERGIIDIAPLAYMRGRTLARSCIILDEAQNTTAEQMMMFLTRLGDGSRMIVTGDITQVDLPRNKLSGLKQAIQVLRDIEGIKLFFFDAADVVRHPLVQRILMAYNRHHDREHPSPSIPEPIRS